MDEDTAAGVYMQAITFAKNEAYSKEVAFHTRKGCRANVQTRDNETGWCFKNGGQPLFGYRAERLQSNLKSLAACGEYSIYAPIPRSSRARSTRSFAKSGRHPPAGCGGEQIAAIDRKVENIRCAVEEGLNDANWANTRLRELHEKGKLWSRPPKKQAFRPSLTPQLQWPTAVRRTNCFSRVARLSGSNSCALWLGR